MAPPSLKLTQSNDELRTEFLALASPRDIAHLLEVPYKTLCFYVFQKHNYSEFLLERANGKHRTISVPVTPFKIIQRKLSQALYAVYGSRSVVHGFVKGRSIKSNAARHLGAKWVLNFDLEDFFPTVHFGRVQGLFAGKPYNLPLEVAIMLARICCHDAALPIGAPTSPIVANMICAKMDSELKSLAWSCGCTYTRYADDISISTEAILLDPKIAYRNLDRKQWLIGNEVLKIIENNSFKVNSMKTRVRGTHSCMEITGIRINSGLNVSRKTYRQVRAMLNAWEKYGEQLAQDEHRSKFKSKQRFGSEPPFREVLRGKIEFIGFIRGRDDRLYVKLIQRLQRLTDIKVKPILIGPSTHESVIRQAVWMLMDKIDGTQGTAFAMQGDRLLTAAHNVDSHKWASRPSFDSMEFFVEVVQRNDELDIAELKLKGTLPVQFVFAVGTSLSLMETICVAGFPKYHEGDSVAFRFGKIVQERKYTSVKHGNPAENVFVQHYIVDADIVKGNSGGPILNEENKVVGIAVKGLGIPGIFDDDQDQLSSFVPVSALSLPVMPS